MCKLDFMGTFLIQSKDRTRGTPSDAYFTKLLNLQGMEYMSIKSISFLNNIYPINSYNNSLQTVYGTVPETLNITIAPGNYSATQLASQLQTSLNNASISNGFTTTYAVSFNNITSKITIVATGPGGNLEACTGTLAPVLGFNTTTTNLSSTYVGSDPVNINYTNTLSIISSELTKYNHPSIRTDLKAGAMIYNFPLNALIFGGNVYIESKNQDQALIDWDPSQILNSFDIQIVDDQGRLAPMNNSEYVLEINLYKKCKN